jgi:hypothetical protein
MPAIEIGIKNSLAKYNPAVIKKMRRSFFYQGIDVQSAQTAFTKGSLFKHYGSYKSLKANK